MRYTALVAALVLMSVIGGVSGAVGMHRLDQAATGWTSPAGPMNVPAVVAAVQPAVMRIEVTVSAGRMAGSGIVLTPTGDLVTNAHVMQDATAARLTGLNGTYTARVVAKSPADDLAWLHIDDASGLPVARLGDSGAVRVGEDVVAIGNGLDLAGAPSVTRGIVSALGRSTDSLDGLIQTDAAISSGNSGGALVDPTGAVIGITSEAAVGNPSTTTENIGFVIPSARVVSVLRGLGLAVPGG
ncbi:trypsin-like peptidase domain-containing protein [Pseudonocardia acidicola]|uniref:Trypsin-like serine protease n=1 Tax=Pseudonocardia acidicola TaxID=2724939 RepID=A0ABX1S7Z7_9PSEU|nr:trypsin-like serine protease [Pseudonocardia acidicola]